MRVCLTIEVSHCRVTIGESNCSAETTLNLVESTFFILCFYDCKHFIVHVFYSSAGIKFLWFGFDDQHCCILQYRSSQIVDCR